MIALLVATLGLAEPLTLEEVLAAADARVPLLREAEASVDGAEAQVLAASAGFDAKLSVEGSRVGGYYPTDRAKASLGVATITGVDLSGGWRVGTGDFAVYDGKAETLSGGEVFGSARLGLRDIGLPPEAVTLRAAEQALAAKGALRDAKGLAVVRKLTESYWKWVRAARLLDAEEELLARAEMRSAGLAAQVAAGAAPEVDQLDNDRLVADRRAKVAAARGKLEVAAVELSLLYRDGEGQPLRPSRDRVPAATGPTPLPLGDIDGLVAHALARHPERAAVDAEVERADVLLRGARRAVAPDLAVVAGVSRDFGTGSSSLAPTEIHAGLEWKAGLLWRDQRAKLAKASAELDGAEARRDWRSDAIVAEVRAAVASLEAATQAWAQASLGASAAAELARLEARRVELGASDLLRLALREEALWGARRAVADAEAAWGIAKAELLYAVGGRLPDAAP